MTRSLGYSTDLAVLRRQGSVVEDHRDHVVVRTPGNPAFRWGNFVLVPDAEDPGRIEALHAAAFPGSDFTTAGIDDPGPAIDEEAWRAAGFGVDRNTVLAARTVRPAAPSSGAVRALRAEDWEDVVRIDVEGVDEPDHGAFVRRRIAARRAMVERGGAAWFGVEVDGRIVAAAGIADAGDSTARFQDVGTLAAHRRRGHAGALVSALGAYAVHRLGAQRLVIVAEPDGPAIGLYRRLGFREAEEQVQLERRAEAGA